jgi:diguanylate cyclase (GGDEF)-like protein
VSETALPRIMIVDDSRIVRATIIKRIRDRFDVREEADGEAGWETLLIDPTIQLVITDYSMPRLDGYGLIERIRAAKVARVRDVPVIMISGEESEEARQRAKDLGATDFITKGTGTAELVARLDALVGLGRTQEALQQAREEAAIDPASGLLAPLVLLRQVEQAMAHAKRHCGNLSVLVIGLDAYDSLVSQEGQGLAEALMARFAKVLAGAVRTEDCLARWQTSRFAIVTPGIDGAQTRRFAERLRGAVAGASIQHQGRVLRVTVTIGLACFPEIGEQTAQAFLDAAEKRMAEGMAAGGNRVCEDAAERVPHAGGETAGIDEALRDLAAGNAAAVVARLSDLGYRLLPLLTLLETHYRFGMPVAEMEKRLVAGSGESSSLNTEE